MADARECAQLQRVVDAQRRGGKPAVAAAIENRIREIRSRSPSFLRRSLCALSDIAINTVGQIAIGGAGALLLPAYGAWIGFSVGGGINMSLKILG